MDVQRSYMLVESCKTLAAEHLTVVWAKKNFAPKVYGYEADLTLSDQLGLYHLFILRPRHFDPGLFHSLVYTAFWYLIRDRQLVVCKDVLGVFQVES